jgi:hypothetical protein
MGFRDMGCYNSSDSSLPQRIGPLDLNEALFYRGLGPRGLYHKEMMRAGAYPVQVKLPCPLWLLWRRLRWLLWEEMAVAELSCPLEAIEVAVVELLAQYKEMIVTELLVEQEEWQVHVSQVTTSVFDLIVYAASVVISAHLRIFLRQFHNMN